MGACKSWKMLELYHMSTCPYCRSVRLLAKDIGVEFQLKDIITFKGEHLTPEYLKVNPQHTVPTLAEGDCRAIMRYLMGKFCPDSPLYPKDLKVRAMVDHRLDFDIGTLSSRFGQLVLPVLYKGAKSMDPEKKKSFEEALQWLDSFIESSGGCCAADHLTIADYAIFTVVDNVEAMEVVDLSAFENIVKWMKKCRAEMKGYEEIEEKLLPEIKERFLSKLG
ncbi:unnamed protein product [Darwinula stevensoni]|uniref:Glutathione S-transferase n=1 Tax=Darwinula stevensoni TaxID=69355 RepID=A0A7R9ADS2_9CRUS|nr:unnamed protein product [Darwinula stevensoni]CAG0901575.1 unnamed protein product [Darwinula stevensoni]